MHGNQDLIKNYRMGFLAHAYKRQLFTATLKGLQHVSKDKCTPHKRTSSDKEDSNMLLDYLHPSTASHWTTENMIPYPDFSKNGQNMLEAQCTPCY